MDPTPIPISSTPRDETQSYLVHVRRTNPSLGTAAGISMPKLEGLYARLKRLLN